ncbi:MAG: alanine racemase [Acidobacteriota bacterium]|nr:alanine racemase [Acidobacteriota bacterium]
MQNRPTWAEINLENLAENYRSIRSIIGESVAVMAVVKADAYGHGAVHCARTLSDEGAAWFGVATPEEAAELRQSGIEQPILSLGGFWRGQETLCFRERITPAIFNIELAKILNRAAKERGEIADVHVKVDTGMNRLGVRFDELAEFADKLKELKNLRVDGLMSHFAAADESCRNDFTNEQISRFDEAIRAFHEKGFRPTWCDLANSPGTLAHPRSWKNLVRIGGALYGIGKDIFPPSETVDRLKPVMRVRSEIMLLKRVPAGETIGYGCSFKTERDSAIASVPIGYNDGVPRALSNQGKVIVNGKTVSVVGRVSMDLILVDVTDVEDARLFDEVVFIGEQQDAQIKAEEIAEIADTISYDITCGISKRVPRHFKG